MDVANQLADRFPGRTFLSDMEFPVVTQSLKPGVKPCCDGSVAVIMDGELRPLVLYEYKPVVDPRSQSVDVNHLMEVAIQGYYCLHQHKVCTVVQCLTDLYQWYYFKAVKTTYSKLHTEWYGSIYKTQDLEGHIKFLLPVVNDL